MYNHKPSDILLIWHLSKQNIRRFFIVIIKNNPRKNWKESIVLYKDEEIPFGLTLDECYEAFLFIRKISQRHHHFKQREAAAAKKGAIAVDTDRK